VRKLNGGRSKKNLQEIYILKSKRLCHEELTIVDSGLVINPQWPFMAASPDGVINCTYSEEGRGVLETKCPYTHRFESIEESASNDRNLCLKEEQDGSFHLDRTHEYYYLVQTQIFVCDVDYCDFCVCTFPAETKGSTLFIEHIVRNDMFWKDCITKFKLFFITCLLPEILENWYTQSPVTSTPSSAQLSSVSNDAVASTSKKQLYCYCHGPEVGTMVGCDNTDCKIEWFHTVCLEMKSVPKGQWYCPDCWKLPQFSKGKEKGKISLL